MNYRITEHDAWEADILQCLDVPSEDAEFERCVDLALERLMTTDETVMAALLNSPWERMQAECRS